MTEIEQGSDAWKMCRLGKVTASRICDVMEKTKTGWGASRATYMGDLLAERLSGNPTEGYTNTAMEWGTRYEPDARAEYELRMRCDVEQVAFVDHPTIPMSGASPDGYVGTDGLIEIKCPFTTKTHAATLLRRSAPSDYMDQMMWQMACTGREWVDFVSFDPRLCAEMQLFVVRVPRDDARIAELEKAVRGFLTDLDQKIADLEAIYIKRRDPLLNKLQASAELAAAS